MYRILIIEDDRTIANVLAEHLRTWDYEVHCVTNFKNVMEDFREYEPQLVLLDIVLPLFNGSIGARRSARFQKYRLSSYHRQMII
jgi:hypothetical protein